MSVLWLKDEAIIVVLFGAGSSSFQVPPGGGEAEQKATGWPWTLCLESSGLLACKQDILLVHRPLLAPLLSSEDSGVPGGLRNHSDGPGHGQLKFKRLREGPRRLLR